MNPYTFVGAPQNVALLSLNGDVVSLNGGSVAQAEAARASLEVVTEEVGVDEWEVGWIIGKKGQTINEMQDMSKCRISVTHKGGKPVVELIGVKTSVDKARALVAYTVESAQDQRQKEIMIHKLSGELRSLGISEGG